MRYQNNLLCCSFICIDTQVKVYGKERMTNSTILLILNV